MYPRPSGRACWRGVSPGNLSSSCGCATDPPMFDIAFPVPDRELDVTTAAPSPLTDNPILSTTTVTAAKSAVPTEIYYVTSDDITAFTTFVNDTDGITPRAWVDTRDGALRLILAVLALLFLVIFLCVLFACYLRKKKKRKRCVTDRPAVEGCEADTNRYELKVATPIQTSQNDYDLIQIDCNDRNTRQTPKARTDSPPNNTESHPSPEPVVRRNTPVIRTVKAGVAADGAVPEKPIRPVSRQNSDAPLVKFETPVYRDRWKDGSRSYGFATNNKSPEYPSSVTEPNWRYPGQSEKLNTLSEMTAEKANKEPTKLDFLPSRLFASPRILGSPSGKKSKGRPDSSTPLFDGDSLSSTEA